MPKNTNTVIPKPKPKPKVKAEKRPRPIPIRKSPKTTLKQKDFAPKQTLVKKPVKGVSWKVDEPKGQQRIRLHKVCPKCILVTPKKSASAATKNDPKNYKFPICTKLSQQNNKNPKCEVNCTGVLAANRRARLTRIYPDVQKLTGKLLQKFKCTKASVAREKQNLMNKNNQNNKKK